MKTLMRSILVVWACAGVVHAQSNLNLTNDVPITESGVHLIISGGALPWLEPTAAPTELRLEAPISWCLHSTSSNSYGLLWLRSSNSFVVNLTTTNGVAVPKTARGESMGVAPKSLLNPYDQGAVPIRVGGGRVDVGDFPKLTELFVFPSNGTYILEAQCWAWSQSKKRFILSPAARVRVVKDDTKAHPAGKALVR